MAEKRRLAEAPAPSSHQPFIKNKKDHREKLALPANDAKARITSGAMRMRISRQRRREGVRCVTFEMRETEIDRLIELGHLSAAHRIDRNSLVQALYRFLDRSALNDAHRR